MIAGEKRPFATIAKGHKRRLQRRSEEERAGVRGSGGHGCYHLLYHWACFKPYIVF